MSMTDLRNMVTWFNKGDSAFYILRTLVNLCGMKGVQDALSEISIEGDMEVCNPSLHYELAQKGDRVCATCGMRIS